MPDTRELRFSGRTGAVILANVQAGEGLHANQRYIFADGAPEKFHKEVSPIDGFIPGMEAMQPDASAQITLRRGLSYSSQ